MIVALDLETTWLDNSIDSIIEIALVRFDEKTFKIVDTFSTLINPEVEIPEFITNITNISQDDVKDKPKWDEKKDEIADFIGDNPILGHNTQFDSWFLQANGIALKNNIELDTFQFANFLLLDEKSLSLESLSVSLGLELEWAHRALNDTHATIKLFHLLVDKMMELSTIELKFFNYVANKSEDKSFLFVYNELLLKKSEKEEDEWFLVDLLKILPSKWAKVIRQHNSELDFWNLEEFISWKKDLELRDNQYKMSQMISKTFQDEEKIVIEAPTGVGKTFAYLFPSIIHSIKTGEQVYISTSTKALQDQIFYKDLEFLSKKFEHPFSFTKLKWKANYIGVSAFIGFVTGIKEFDKKETSFILKILFWLISTKSWELDELDFYGKEYSYLKEISADDLITFSKENAFEKYEFAVNARRRARKANIVIINNNILFQDIDWDNAILGKVENLILDEAHSLEDVITNSLRKGFCLRDFEKHLINIEKIIRKHKFTITDLWKKTDILIFEMWIVFDSFQIYLNKKIRSDSKYQDLLIQEDFYDTDVDDVEKKELLHLIQLKLTDFIDIFSVVPDKIYLALWRDIQFLEMSMKTLEILLDNGDKNRYIKLIQYNERRGGLILEYTRLHVWKYLEKKLWNSLHSCVLTSATLKIGESFDYINRMLHLEDFSFEELESDFDYSQQALLFIPDDLWNIKNNLSVLIDFLLQLFLVVRGNTLVLFTAFYAIKETYSRSMPVLKKEGISLYAQSIWGGKHKLIEAFKQKSESSILIGTDTFWEWIDIPWDDLKYLVIHKVPFMVPSDPIFQARSTLFKNAFMEYGVPKSILKLKQGFGRLIRKKTDTGVVIFLDDRIYSTSWWDVLYKAFPDDIKIRRWWWKDFIKILEDREKD